MQQRGESWHGESLPALPLQAAACLLGGRLGLGRALGREGFPASRTVWPEPLLPLDLDIRPGLGGGWLAQMVGTWC